MAIGISDVKLLESEVMADTTDGGGRITSRVIPDGVAGNIFPKVSRLDSTYGRVNLRKIYCAVQTASSEMFAGAHAILTDAPDNEKINILMFSTKSDFDTRTSAKDRIEAYVTSGPESRMMLMGRQLAGQQMITAYQRLEEPLPEVGDVYCLSTESGSTVTAQQYFRVQSVESEVRTFVEATNMSEFQRRVVTIGTGSPLAYDFSGPDSVTQVSNPTRSSKVRETTVVDAARYFGIKKLAQAVAQNALSCKVDTIYSPIVPTTNRETALSQVNISTSLKMVKIGPDQTVSIAPNGWANNANYYVKRGIYPGSLRLTINGTVITDNKLGALDHALFSGEVDYENGMIKRTGGSGSGAVSVTYSPAVARGQPSHTKDIQVTLATRGTVYSLVLLPIPAINSLIIDYRALGKWYRLYSRGDGSIKGADQAYGVGTIDYSTGAVVVTLGALPDVGSSVLFAWATTEHYAQLLNDVSPTLKQEFFIPDVPIIPGSLTITFQSGGTPRTVTSTTLGILSGSGVTGTVDVLSGKVVMRYSTMVPDANTNVACDYQQDIPLDPEDQYFTTVNATVVAGEITLGAPVVPGSFRGRINYGLRGLVSVADDGAGVVLAKAGQVLGGSYTIATDTPIGSISYETGVVTVTAAPIGFTGIRWEDPPRPVIREAGPVQFSPG